MISNINVKLEKSSQNLTSDTGVILISKLLDNLNINNYFDQLHFSDERFNPIFTNTKLLHFKIINLLLGYDSQTLQAKAIDDKVFTTFMDVPSQSSISRLFNRINSETISGMNDMIASGVRDKINSLDTIILDADSTYVTCNGEQELSKHNVHYNTHGYHPLIITEGNTDLVLTAKLRSGNTHCADGLEKQMEYLFKTFDFTNKTILYRADSQFGNKSKLDCYEEYNLQYTVKMMRRDKKLGNLVKDTTHQLIAKDNLDLDIDAPLYGQLQYESKTYGLITVSFKSEILAEKTLDKNDKQLKLFDTKEYDIDYQIIISNIVDSPENIFDFYNKRGNSENIFKELKQNFGMNKLSHSQFIQNEFEFLFSCYSYNVYKLMLCEIPQIDTNITLALFIRKYTKFASKIVFHARQITLKIDKSYRWINEFFQIYNSV